jgi:hypothetical protein
LATFLPLQILFLVLPVICKKDAKGFVRLKRALGTRTPPLLAICHHCPAVLGNALYYSTFYPWHIVKIAMGHGNH